MHLQEVTQISNSAEICLAEAPVVRPQKENVLADRFSLSSLSGMQSCIVRKSRIPSVTTKVPTVGPARSGIL
ncbi:hypothetical protein ZHAS_00019581 [Anopheles sinensis]|uniref:Uncharacterized protein n=1 Tax=Anopheles sinensis TaxID=74873 RepID=A0A084WMS6_ANOSI|nr:hypothetical protein ZHAS_00019581 [Anopheles sinensis]